jgi:hypothetical protein
MNVAEIRRNIQQIADKITINTTADDFCKLWKYNISKEAANSFIRYYRDMRLKITQKKQKGRAKKTRKASKKQRGGMAPINDYAMTPGMPVATYGNFPTELATNGTALHDLDVFFQNSLPISPPGYWPSVPANMGSNQVGGSRRYRRNTRRKQRGGNLMSSLEVRPIPFLSSAPPNILQTSAHSWSGNPTQFPAAGPEFPAWQPHNSAGNLITPNTIATINNNFGTLASVWGVPSTTT